MPMALNCRWRTSHRAAQLAELSEIPTRVVSLTDEQAIEWALIELSIVGKSFLCLYATWARRLYVIDVPGLPQIAGYNGMPPVQWNAVSDSRFGALITRHRIQSNLAMRNAVLLRSEFRIVHCRWLKRCPVSEHVICPLNGRRGYPSKVIDKHGASRSEARGFLLEV
jgi:hypothetical protein